MNISGKSHALDEILNKNQYIGRNGTYKRLIRLGSGTYANVYQGICIETGRLVAIKVVKISPNEGAPATAVREISLMMAIKHENVVEIYDVVYNGRQFAIIVELMDSDLKAFMIKRGGSLSPQICKKLMKDILQGLSACHAQYILHRDLKPQNLLLSPDMKLKIADFGLGRDFGIPTPSFSCEVVTLWYRPPEVLLGSTYYDTSIDIWSVGCVMMEMLTGRVLVHGENHITQLLAIFRLTGIPTEYTWPGVTKLPLYMEAQEAYNSWISLNCQKSKIFSKSQLIYSLSKLLHINDNDTLDLISLLLQPNPSERISAVDALNHRYFTSP